MSGRRRLFFVITLIFFFFVSLFFPRPLFRAVAPTEPIAPSVAFPRRPAERASATQSAASRARPSATAGDPSQNVLARFRVRAADLGAETRSPRALRRGRRDRVLKSSERADSVSVLASRSGDLLIFLHESPKPGTNKRNKLEFSRKQNLPSTWVILTFLPYSEFKQISDI